VAKAADKALASKRSFAAFASSGEAKAMIAQPGPSKSLGQKLAWRTSPARPVLATSCSLVMVSGTLDTITTFVGPGRCPATT